MGLIDAVPDSRFCVEKIKKVNGCGADRENPWRAKASEVGLLCHGRENGSRGSSTAFPRRYSRCPAGVAKEKTSLQEQRAW